MNAPRTIGVATPAPIDPYDREPDKGAQDDGHHDDGAERPAFCRDVSERGTDPIERIGSIREDGCHACDRSEGEDGRQQLQPPRVDDDGRERTDDQSDPGTAAVREVERRREHRHARGSRDAHRSR